MSIDLDRQRAELLALRDRHRARPRRSSTSSASTTRPASCRPAGGPALADHATDTLDREVDDVARGERRAGRRARSTTRSRASTTAPTAPAPSAARRSREERLDAVPYAMLCLDDKRRRGAAGERARTARRRGAARRPRRLDDERAAADLERRAVARAPSRRTGCRSSSSPGAAVGADQLTKSSSRARSPLGDGVAVLGPFRIHHVRNSGIAFGLFASSTSAVILLTACAVGGDARLLLRALRPAAPASAGRARARARRQHLEPHRPRPARLRDGLPRLRYWPAFNLADTFIVVGVGLLFVSFVAADRTSPRVGTAPLSRS